MEISQAYETDSESINLTGSQSQAYASQRICSCEAECCCLSYFSYLIVFFLSSFILLIWSAASIPVFPFGIVLPCIFIFFGTLFHFKIVPVPDSCQAHKSRYGCHVRSAIVAWIILLILIRFASAVSPPPDDGDKFPTECYKNFGGRIPMDCTHVSRENNDEDYLHGYVPTAQGGLFSVQAPFDAVVTQTQNWAESLSRASSRKKPNGLTHTIAVTMFAGLTDDLFSFVECDQLSGYTIVSAHFQQRIGIRSLGVIGGHMKDFLNHLREHDFGPPVNCTIT